MQIKIPLWVLARYAHSYIAAILSRGRTQSLMALGVYPTLWPKTAVLWPSGFSVVVDHADHHR